MTAAGAGVFAGQVGVVTGAAQGIGRAVAEELSAGGMLVVGADVQAERLQAVAAELSASGRRMEAAPLDVTDSAAVDALFAAVAERHGRLDALVTAAGVAQAHAPITELDDQAWSRVLDVNLTGVFRCCRAAGAIMRRARAGSIVNIASINGLRAAPLLAAYNATKAAVASLTETAAIDLANDNVRVNAVAPGPIRTELNQAMMARRASLLGVPQAQLEERIAAAVPLGRWGEPRDVAAAVAFLCSPAAAWITGEVLRVSGGLDALPAPVPGRLP